MTMRSRDGVTVAAPIPGPSMRAWPNDHAESDDRTRRCLPVSAFNEGMAE